MNYRIRVAGKLFEGKDHRRLLRMAVAAKKSASTTGERRLAPILPEISAGAPTAA